MTERVSPGARQAALRPGWRLPIAAYLAADGVRVNAVSPGPFPHGRAAGSRKFMERLVGRCLLGRVGRPEELKGAVLYLAAGASGFVTGQNLVVDGGWTVR